MQESAHNLLHLYSSLTELPVFCAAEPDINIHKVLTEWSGLAGNLKFIQFYLWIQPVPPVKLCCKVSDVCLSRLLFYQQKGLFWLTLLFQELNISNIHRRDFSLCFSLRIFHWCGFRSSSALALPSLSWAFKASYTERQLDSNVQSGKLEHSGNLEMWPRSQREEKNISQPLCWHGSLVRWGFDQGFPGYGLISAMLWKMQELLCAHSWHSAKHFRHWIPRWGFHWENNVKYKGVGHECFQLPSHGALQGACKESFGAICGF